MNTLTKLRGLLTGRKKKDVPPYAELTFTRRKLGQRIEAAHNVAGVPVPAMQESLMDYATNPWMFSGVSLIAETCALATLEVRRRDTKDLIDDHALYDLLGDGGRPNDADDTVEFFERHFSNLLLVRNSYWLWFSQHGGVPDAVYHLEPQHVRVVPGTNRRIAHYLYEVDGQGYKVDPVFVTHFKGFHPLNMYHGMPIHEPGRYDIRSDREMARWNNEYFDGPSVPHGIAVVPPETTDEQIDELQDELEAKYRGQRRTAVMRADPGAVSWIDAGLRHGDLQFIEGRKMTRQVAYEMLHLPLGLLSEASTEAHARVAERFFLKRCYRLGKRTGVKLTTDVLPFYDGLGRDYISFEDVRVADWTQEKAKWESYKVRQELGFEIPEGTR